MKLFKTKQMMYREKALSVKRNKLNYSSARALKLWQIKRSTLNVNL